MKNLKSEIKEILWIVKNCFTTFWFWLPALFYVLLCFELYLIGCVNPLLALIIPTILVVYALSDEKRRMKLQYGLKSLKEEPYSLKVAGYLRPFRWRVEKSVEEYEELLKKDKERETKEKKEEQ